MKNTPTPIALWGKDHWSLLGYVECVCVDNAGYLAIDKMRANPDTHPLMSSGPMRWKPEYSTRLAGFFAFQDRTDIEKAAAAGHAILGHDDWDCLDDLEAAGLLEVLSLAQCKVRMTDQGTLLASELRKHKASGGMFANFRVASEVPA